MRNYRYIIWLILIIVLLVLVILNLSLGAYDIGIKDSMNGIFKIGSPENVNIIQNVRLPRTIAALCLGATLALSGFFMRFALRNPLADSSILGVQTGATTLTLIVLLYFPLMYYLVPIVAFCGGILAFVAVVLITGPNNFKSSSLILSGVVINAFFTAIIGILTILNPMKLQGALNYLNGSLISITKSDGNFLLIAAIILIIGSFIMIPILKILLLDDLAISNLGISAQKYRMLCAIYAIILASLTVAFAGVISFVGIIIPELASKLTNQSIKDEMISTILLGSILVIGSDLMQRLVFAPMEIPVGLIIGLGCAPLFLIILRRNHYGS